LTTDRSAFLTAALALASLGADAPAPRGYVCGRAPAPIAVDGRLDDEAWKAAPWTEDFVDIEGDARPRPRFRTRAKMAWDDEFFYVAAEMEEPHVWGTLTRHDSVIFQDNDFEAFIDPDGDNHEYYEIEVNALNTGWDLLLEKPYRDGGPAVNAWEIPGLKTATHVDGRINDPVGVDRSWTVEMAIPWKVLAERAHRPTPPGDGDQWRVNFSRVQWQHFVDGSAYKKVAGRREDNWVWSPQGAVDMHRPERFGYVQFSTGPPGRASFRPDPAGPTRDRLIRIYQAQRTYREKNGTWAATMEALGIPDEPAPAGESPPIIRATRDGFEATIAREPRADGTRQTWSIRQDSRITRRDE